MNIISHNLHCMLHLAWNLEVNGESEDFIFRCLQVPSASWYCLKWPFFDTPVTDFDLFFHKLEHHCSNPRTTSPWHQERLTEREFAYTWCWGSELGSSASSLPPSYAWAEAVGFLPTSHKRPMLWGQKTNYLTTQCGGLNCSKIYKGVIYWFYFVWAHSATHLPQQFPRQKPWKYQTWRSPHSVILMILLWTGWAGKKEIHAANEVVLEIRRKKTFFKYLPS